MKKRLIAGVLAGAAMLTVAYAFAQGPGGPGGHGPGMHGPGMHGPMMKRMISARLDEAMSQAKVTAEQRTAIVAARDRAFTAMDAQRPDPRAARDQMLGLFEADRLDVGQLQTLHAQMEQQHQQVRAAVAQAIVDVHDTLTPAQRKIVADYVRAHGPGPRS
jgi:Spy/CpxP family protein refolding chaperone